MNELPGGRCIRCLGHFFMPGGWRHMESGSRWKDVCLFNLHLLGTRCNMPKAPTQSSYPYLFRLTSRTLTNTLDCVVSLGKLCHYPLIAHLSYQLASLTTSITKKIRVYAFLAKVRNNVWKQKSGGRHIYRIPEAKPTWAIIVVCPVPARWQVAVYLIKRHAFLHFQASHAYPILVPLGQVPTG